MDVTSHHSPGDSIQPLSPFYLLFIILIEGFITISVEILTLRQLIPFAGNNVNVTSIIIGVFLLFLAFGYKQGGQAKNNFYNLLNRNFCLAAVLLGVGLSYVFIDLFFYVGYQFLGGNILLILSIYLLLIIAPVVYCLGQTVPITMNLIKHEQMIGALGGKVLFWSTIGSFLGAVLTSLILFNYFGVASTLIINVGLLLLLTILITFATADNKKLIPLITSIACTPIIYQLNVTFEKSYFLKTNRYSNITVEPASEDYSTPGKILKINNSHSSYVDNNLQGFEYLERIKTILFKELEFKNKKILVLGAGGFTLTAQGNYENQVIYVDIDKDLKPIVEQHFLPQINGNFVAQDARHYLKHTHQKFDAIVFDVYSNSNQVPSHLLTQEFYSLMFNALNNDGYGIFNIIGHPTLANHYTKRIDNTIRSIFKSCTATPLNFKTNSSNLIYVCHKQNHHDNILYTDNLNTVELDATKHNS